MTVRIYSFSEPVQKQKRFFSGQNIELVTLNQGMCVVTTAIEICK